MSGVVQDNNYVNGGLMRNADEKMRFTQLLAQFWPHTRPLTKTETFECELYRFNQILIKGFTSVIC